MPTLLSTLRPTSEDGTELSKSRFSVRTGWSCPGYWFSCYRLSRFDSASVWESIWSRKWRNKIYCSHVPLWIQRRPSHQVAYTLPIEVHLPAKVHLEVDLVEGAAGENWQLWNPTIVLNCSTHMGDTMSQACQVWRCTWQPGPFARLLMPFHIGTTSRKSSSEFPSSSTACIHLRRSMASKQNFRSKSAEWWVEGDKSSTKKKHWLTVR